MPKGKRVAKGGTAVEDAMGVWRAVYYVNGVQRVKVFGPYQRDMEFAQKYAKLMQEYHNPKI